MEQWIVKDKNERWFRYSKKPNSKEQDGMWYFVPPGKVDIYRTSETINWKQSLKYFKEGI